MGAERRFGAWADRPPAILPEQVKKELRAHVVVVGCGMAGITCALRAQQQGARVLVLEKGRAWSARGGNIGVPNSSFMKSRGYENDPQVVAREWIKRAGNRCDERILWRYLRESPRAMDWLVELVQRPEYGARPELQGSRYKGETYFEFFGSHRFFGGPMEKKGMRAGAADCVYAMYCEAQKLGVEFLFETPAEQLLKEDGRVAGVYARCGDGWLLARGSRGVVLATGDIGGSDEMCEDLAPIANRCAAKLYTPRGCNTGDGHRMGYWAGGDFEDGPFPLMLHPQAFHYRSYCFLFVKQDGTRFMNEDTYVQGRTDAILRERMQYAWAIMDGSWKEQVPKTLPYGGGLFWGNDCLAGESEFDADAEQRFLDMGLRRGVVVQADTPEELAERMGAPGAVFAASLKRYNELAALGRDEDFGKRPELLMPLDKPPYYAMKFGPALLAVVGGLRVDENMRVLDAAGGRIPGLYALGNTAGGRYGVDYPVIIPGNSHGTAMTFGFLTGEALGAEPGDK